MGKIAKGQRCTVVGCDAPAVRSLPADDVARAGLKLEGGRRAYLCEEHYKEYKRRTKKERRLERWRLARPF